MYDMHMRRCLEIQNAIDGSPSHQPCPNTHPTPHKTNPTTGSSNAYTDTEDTVYYFDVDSHFLEGALDRFAWFFKAPLFTAR